jgi:hypothetical protein
MNCPICLLTKYRLYNICNTCVTSKICKECITNMENYEIINCPICRTSLNYNIQYSLTKYFIHRLILFLIIASIILVEYAIPVYLLYMSSACNLYWNIKTLTIDIFILKGVICWFYYKYLNINNNYLIPSLFIISFIVSGIVSFYKYYSFINNYNFMFNFYTTIMYEFPCYLITVVILYDYIRLKMCAISIDRYKKYILNYNNVEDAIYIDLIQSTGL